MLLLIVSFAHEKLVDIFIDMSAVCRSHCLERFWWDTRESCCLCIFKLTNSAAEFLPGDGVIELPQGVALWDMLKDGGINRAVVVEDLGKVGAKD
jgi:hypothetical protein